MKWWIIVFAGCQASDLGVGKVTNEAEGVDGDAAMEVEPLSLLITDAEVGYARSETLTITSVGEVDLQISDMRLTSGLDIFYFDAVEDEVIEPGDSEEYQVIATLSVAEPATGTLKISSNDVEDPSIEVALEVWPVGYSDTGGTPPPEE